MKITRDKIYNQFVRRIEPCAAISSGENLTVETLDALFGRAKDVRDKKISAEYCNTRANPATGPIYINGAKPGDTLEVEIRDIRLSGIGFINVPNRGNPTANTYGGYEFVEFEPVSGNEVRALHNNKIYPARPMIGVIGTATDSDFGNFTVETGDHGGNMDNNALTAGTKVYLPVFVEGALLGIGDVHGVMGDGEVFGQGIEFCAEIDITVALKKDMILNRPFVISGGFISAAASAGTLEAAGELAVEDLRYILETYYKLPPVEAALAIALYGDLKVCQTVNQQKTMRMEIKKEMLNLFL